MKPLKIIKKLISDFAKNIFSFWYIKYLRHLKYKKILAKNKNLKNKYKGKRCFLIGNGPSINQMDLTKLENEYTFVFNCFYLHRDFKKIKPKFYFEIDSVEKLPIYGDYFKPGNYFFKIDMVFIDIGTKMFFQIKNKDYIKKNNLFLNKDVYYLLPDKGILQTKKLLDDISKNYSFNDASICSAICVAVYMGFSQIYLIGCDFDHIINKDEKHFFDNEIIGFKSEFGKNVSNLVLAENLYNYLRKLEKVKEHFKKYDVKIFNAGIGGMIDVFPRVDYNSLFKNDD